jgi:glycosyltransferase involved in cell wall biosynthesis
MKISIIIGYYNRKKQLFYTLKTISNSLYKNIEIIIVDDCSDNPEDILYISDFKIFDMDIKLISITKEEKTWVNPCIAYNKGISQSTGDIIILQNAEVCHIGDCIKYVIDNLKSNDWLTFNCYGLNDFKDNEYIYSQNDNKAIYKYINKIWLENEYTFRPGANTAFTDKVGGWINHYLYHFVAYHYLGAIFRDTLMNKMNGGFDEDYANGICYDDNDFIKRLIYNNIRFTTNIFSESEPFVIHLYHEKSKSLIENRDEKWNHNKIIYDEKCKKMNITNDWRLSTFMPYPFLYNEKEEDFSNMNILIGIILHENLDINILHERLDYLINSEMSYLQMEIKLNIIFCVFDINNINILNYIDSWKNKNFINQSSINIDIINYTLDDDTNIYNIKKKYKNDLTLKTFINKGLHVQIYPNNFEK